MALFGKKDTKPKKKQSMTQRLGLNVEKVPSQEEQVEKTMNEQIIRAYKYVRDRIDKGCEDYYRTGNFNKLEEFVAEPALGSITKHLITLRNDNIYWSMPDRMQRTQPQIKIVPSGLKLDSQGRPLEFVVEERYLDYSMHQKLTPEQGFIVDKEAEGLQRVIQSKILVRNGSDFKLVEVIEVKGAMI